MSATFIALRYSQGCRTLTPPSANFYHSMLDHCEQCTMTDNKKHRPERESFRNVVPKRSAESSNHVPRINFNTLDPDVVFYRRLHLRHKLARHSNKSRTVVGAADETLKGAGRRLSLVTGTKYGFDCIRPPCSKKLNECELLPLLSCCAALLPLNYGINSAKTSSKNSSWV